MGLSIITTGFEEGPQRNKALLVYSGTAAGGFSIGLVVGGLLAAVNWRWVFFAPVILTLLILVAALVLIPKSPRPDREGQGVDLGGALSVTGAILLLVFGVERAAHASATVTAATIGAGLVLFGVFIAIERRSASPLVRLGIFRSGSLVRANLAGDALRRGLLRFQFIAVLYLQELRGWSTLQTSFALIVIGVDAILSPTLTPRLVAKFGNARVIFGGLLLAALSYALFLPVGADWTYLAMFPSLIILGLAFSLAYGPLTILATDGVAEEEQGVAGGLLYTSFQFGAALGLSFVATVNIAATDGTSPAALLDGYRAALVVPLVAALVAAVISAFGLRTRSGTGTGDGDTGSVPDAAPDKAVPVEAAR